MPRKATKHKDAELAIMGHTQPPMLVNGGKTIRTLSAGFIAKWQEHFDKKGHAIFDLMYEKHPRTGKPPLMISATALPSNLSLR